jgi:hypothetical protein
MICADQFEPFEKNQSCVFIIVYGFIEDFSSSFTTSCGMPCYKAEMSWDFAPGILGFATLFILTYFIKKELMSSKIILANVAVIVFASAVIFNEVLLITQGFNYVHHRKQYISLASLGNRHPIICGISTVGNSTNANRNCFELSFLPSFSRINSKHFLPVHP